MATTALRREAKNIVSRCRKLGERARVLGFLFHTLGHTSVAVRYQQDGSLAAQVFRSSVVEIARIPSALTELTVCNAVRVCFGMVYGGRARILCCDPSVGRLVRDWCWLVDCKFPRIFFGFFSFSVIDFCIFETAAFLRHASNTCCLLLAAACSASAAARCSCMFCRLARFHSSLHIDRCSAVS